MNDCDEWTGARHPRGYGHVRYEGRVVYAHRLRFFEVFGWWPRVVRHTCDNPPCRNPWHLLPGTQADNLRDMRERGRGRARPGRHYGNTWNRLNEGMPNPRTNNAAYQREQRRRKKAGTWVCR